MIECIHLIQYALNILLIVSIGIFLANASNLPCHFYDSINITDGMRQQQPQPQQPQQQQQHQRDSILFDGIEFRSSQYAVVDYTEDDGMRNLTEPHVRGCFCNIIPCYRLCCSNKAISISDEAIKSLEQKCNEELNQLENEVYDESSKFINLLLGYSFIYFNNKTCLPFFVQEDYLNVMLATRKCWC